MNFSGAEARLFAGGWRRCTQHGYLAANRYSGKCNVDGAMPEERQHRPGMPAAAVLGRVQFCAGGHADKGTGYGRPVAGFNEDSQSFGDDGRTNDDAYG